MPRTDPFKTTIDTLILEHGEKKGQSWIAVLTTGQIITELNKVDHTSYHRNIKTMVEIHYPGTKAEPLGRNGAQGWKLYIKVRTN